MLLVNRHKQTISNLIVNRLAQMTFARDVLNQDHFAGIDDPGFAIAGRDLHPVVEID